MHVRGLTSVAIVTFGLTISAFQMVWAVEGGGVWEVESELVEGAKKRSKVVLSYILIEATLPATGTK